VDQGNEEVEKLVQAEQMFLDAVKSLEALDDPIAEDLAQLRTKLKNVRETLKEKTSMASFASATSAS
jgi:hypothetical protein